MTPGLVIFAAFFLFVLVFMGGLYKILNGGRP